MSLFFVDADAEIPAFDTPYCSKTALRTLDFTFYCYEE